MAAGGQRVVAGDHHGADAHRAAARSKRSRDARLDDVLEVDHAERRCVASATTSGVPPLRGDRRRRWPSSSAGTVPPCSLDPAPHRVGRALADLLGRRRSTPLIRGLRGERDEHGAGRRRASRSRIAVAAPWRARRCERPSGVSSASEGELGGVGQVRLGDAGDRDELDRLPVAAGDGARLVQQQGVARRRPPPPPGRYIASTLCCTSRSMPAMPIADSSPPIVVGIRQTSSAMSTVTDDAASSASRCANGCERRRPPSRKMMREAGQQDRERDLVRRLLAAGALDQRDHPVQEASRPGSAVIRTTIRSDRTRVPPVTAAAVAARLADDRADSPVMADSSTEAIALDDRRRRPG